MNAAQQNKIRKLKNSRRNCVHREQVSEKELPRRQSDLLSPEYSRTLYRDILRGMSRHSLNRGIYVLAASHHDRRKIGRAYVLKSTHTHTHTHTPIHTHTRTGILQNCSEGGGAQRYLWLILPYCPLRRAENLTN